MQGNTINYDVTMGGTTGAILAGRYRVVRQLGQGGMGSVWLAEDTKLDGFKVAIKMLPSVLVNNKRAYAQVKAEALVSLKLSHPNIATVRAFEEEGGSPFLVMDYIDGQTLDDYLAEKGTLTEEEAVKLLKPVAAALDYAHTQGVVHRDVKPGNIMIRKDGTPFVLDFGIAREIQETMTRVTGKLSSGTLLYMSPEQLNGDAPKPAQDIYSFAAMAYECLKGEPPFSRGQIEYQIVNNKPEPLDPQFANCGPGVMAGLEKQPENRPASCSVLFVPDRGRAESRSARPAAEARCNEELPLKRDGGKGWLIGTLLAVLMVAVIGVLHSTSDGEAERRRLHEAQMTFDRARTSLCEQVRKLEAISREDGFGSRMDAISEKMPTGIGLRDSSSFLNAAQNCAGLEDECRQLLFADGPRVRAKTARDAARAAKQKAQSQYASQDAREAWQEAESAYGQGQREFVGFDFEKAQSSFAQSGQLYEKSASEAAAAREERQKAELARQEQKAKEEELRKKNEKEIADLRAASAVTSNITGSVQRDYMEIEHLKTEISIAKIYVDGVVSQLNNYEKSKTELGIGRDFDEIAELKSAFDVDLSGSVDLMTVSNAWQAVFEARRRMDEYLAKFKMARLAYDRVRSARDEASKARDAFIRTEASLAECEVKRLAPEKFDAAMSKSKQAADSFSAEQYGLAKISYDEAVALAKEALRSARECKAKAALQSAESFLANKQWQLALDKAEESLRWQPNDEDAQRIKREARSHLAPILTLCATIDGKPVEGARFIGGRFAMGATLPWTSAELEDGSEIEPFTVEYISGKRKWRGSFKAIQVDWRGRKTLSCPLKPYREGGCEFVPMDLDDEAEYLVIDLSAGPNADRYEVSYLKNIPEDGWDDEYKSRKLVLRRVLPGSFKRFAGSIRYQYKNSSNVQTVKLTKRFYIGVFEVTCPQWQLVMGKDERICIGNKGWHPIWYEKGTFPCREECAKVRGKRYGIVDVSRPAEDSFLGRLRRRTGIDTLELPTARQWEYACRAGTETDFYTGNGPDALDRVGWYRKNSVPWYSTADWLLREVGLKDPNEFGLYDMHGNVSEFCLNEEDGDLCRKGGDGQQERWEDCASSSISFGGYGYEGFRLVAN